MAFVQRLILALALLLFGIMAAPAKAQTTYYGPPYYPPVAAGASSPFSTIPAAVQAWYLYYETKYGFWPSVCTLGYTPAGGGNWGSTVELMWISSNSPGGPCGGGPSGVQGTAYSYDPVGNLGHPGCSCAGDPINLATGNEFREDVDFQQSWLTFSRYYNSDINIATTAIGMQWRHSFDRSLQLSNPNTTSTSGALPPSFAVLYRPDGMQEVFTKSNGQWTANGAVADRLTETDNTQGQATGYTAFIAASRQWESYNTAGQLQSVTDESGVGVNLVYSTSTTASNIAPSPGLLLTVTDPNGRQLSFTYTSSGQVYQVTQPDGGVLTYSYNASTGNLLSVQYPDGKTLQYGYTTFTLSGSATTSELTSLVDEVGTNYANLSYDGYGRATQTNLAGGVNLTKVTYNSNGTTSVQYPAGGSATFGFTTSQGRLKTTSVNQPCAPTCGEMAQAQSYDVNSYPQSATDFNGNVTATTYDANGLLDQQVDASGSTNQRTTATTWNTTLRVPLTRTVSNANGTIVSSAQWVYNANGQTLARCDIDSTNSAATGYTCATSGTIPAGVRRSTYTYCTAVDTVQCPLVGLMLTATGPRTDLTQTTTYSYYMASSAVNCGTPGAACYQPGDLHTVTDALGHVTTIASYDADGRPTRITDANGVNTDMTYTPRGWLASRTVGGATTSFTYTAYGAMKTITDPDGVTTTYGYDTAHRLTTITDALGNYIQYTLDAAGDKTGEQVYDSTGTVHKSLTRTFNTLGQLTTVVDGLKNTVFNASASGNYDANGNLIQSSDGLGIQRQLSYDALNRLVQTLDNYNGSDTATQNTKTAYTYDSLDRLTQVTDPSSLNTTYTFDGLSDATSQVSPDTGTTSSAFDAAGNVLTRTDAKGIVASSTYDALDRLITTSYPDTTQNVTYSYDDPNSTTSCASSYPTGRLTRIIEATVTTVYCYDARGNVIQKQQITGSNTDTTGYSITAAGRLSGITYPSGTLVGYVRDADGRIQSVSLTPVNGTAGTVVSSVTYQPFGPVSGYTLGNGQAIARTYDTNYRLTDLTSLAFNLHLARDAMGDITAIGNAPGASPATETYAYDPLYRLLSVTEASGTVLESVTYNQTGDRLSKTGSGLATGTYSYNPNTHQLIATGNAARTVDADGNTTAISEAGGSYGFGYSDRNRMVVAQLGGSTIASYTYNALSQRIQKVANSNTERYGYNEDSQMLDEYGVTNRDYIWVDGIPVANVDTSGTTSTIAYVTADQLGTPRAIADSSGNTEWQNAYQGNPWDERASTSSGYVYNLGFPGQYFDVETSLSDNVNRTFDPSVGGYMQADPLGFSGGQSSLYAYVGGNPLDFSDPLGEKDYLDQCVGRYAACKASQDPNGSTLKNYLMFKGCKASLDWGSKEAGNAGTAYSCEADFHDCSGALKPGEPSVDPKTMECYKKYEICSGGSN